ncbi:MAG: Gfo/Idh/MocA family oxidoreductase [Armatimonadetes bacterium]|nr:Gfo/Idh/MocA family oxidoreductase [Armatimonadota bacterium]
MEDNSRKITRRQFVASTASTAVALTVIRRHVLGGPRHISPNEKLNVACIGCGGKGESDIGGVSSENIVALCDVDEGRAAGAIQRFPNAARYNDWRVMLEKEDHNIDAVTVSTPDHTHAPAAMAAIELGKHVYVQKPLTHSVYEAQRLIKAARHYKVATQMGNQGHAGEDTRKLCEWIWQGGIGTVKEVHFWTDRPIWAQGIDRPADSPPVPANLNWDVWLGVAPERPYHPAYHPFSWRGWWDFGCGAIGDMACHIMDAGFWALQLQGPCSVEAESPGLNSETFPKWSVITFEFPARGAFPPVKAVWYDGGKLPTRPPELDEWVRKDEEQAKKMALPTGSNGQMYIGDKGVLVAGCYGDGPAIYPQQRMLEFLDSEPKKTLKRSPGHYKEWIDACKGGEPASGNFDHAGPLTITALLGNVALRAGEKIRWNGKTVTNVPKAKGYLRREYRKGWRL